MKKDHLNLKAEEKEGLKALIQRPETGERLAKRAKGLIFLDEGNTYVEVARLVKVSYPTILNWAKKYRTSGLDFLNDKPRPGRPIEILPSDRKKIIELAQSPPPKGRNRWSLRLIAEKAVEKGLVKHLSHNQVRAILKDERIELL